MGLVEDSKRPDMVEKDDIMGAANANFDNDGETKTQNIQSKSNNN